MTDTLTEISDLAEELCDARQHREPRWGYSKHRNKIKLKDHVSVHPGLLIQLHDAVAPILGGLDDGGARGVPSSTPPLQLEALDRYIDIETTALTWCSDLGLTPRTDTAHRLWLDLPGTVRSLVGAQLGARAGALLRDLRRWRSWAATMAGWQVIFAPHVPCPVTECGKSGLRINLDKQTAICVECRCWWDETTIPGLGLYIQSLTGRHERVPVRSSIAGHGGWASRATEGATP